MTAGGSHQTLREFLAGSGEVGRDMLTIDWAATRLGPLDEWSASLSTVVRTMLSTRFSMWMAWGPELVFLCNDAYRRNTLGRKYPWALGRPAPAVWEEAWTVVGPMIDRVIATGEATWNEGMMLILERSGFREETYHTFSYSPLAGDDGTNVGMLCVVSEETERVINERRMATLRELGSVAAGVHEERALMEGAAEVLNHNLKSLPFTLVYVFAQDGLAHLRCASGITPGAPVAPRVIDLLAGDGPWPAGRESATAPVIVDLTGEAWHELPTGAWGQPPERALILPIPQSARPEAHGFFVAGLNRYRPLDSDYQAFVGLVAQHFAAGLAAARAYESERARSTQLEELDRAKTTFFSNISHEFRTPLTLMLGPLQDARAGDGELGPERTELVHRNATRLLKLVNALLDFSRAEAGKMQAEFRPTDIAVVTADLAGTFREATERAGVALVIACEPPADEVYVDRDLWERIVLNLISNAFKATVEGQITVSLRQTGRYVRLAVSDTGTGISADEIDQLFQRFHRVRTVARSYEGSGIGLALVKELVELHGGVVDVTSTPGEGSEFSVTIPVGADHVPAEQVVDEPIDPAASIASLFVEEAMSWVDGTVAPARVDGDGAGRSDPVDAGGRPRVLIADDNPDLRRYLSTLLQAQFEVEAVGDGNGALEIVSANPPDLLISDVMMPGLDGYELLDAVRSRAATRDLPVLLLSARAGEESAIAGLQAGADDYLPKPFSGRELLARVRAHLDLAALRRQAAADVRAERVRLEQTLRQLPAGVMLAEAPSGRLILGNEQAAEILGHPIVQIETIDDDDAFPLHALDGSPLARADRPIARAILAEEIVEDRDLLYRRPDGRQIIVRTSAGPIRDADGTVVAGVLVFQDVSARVRTERLLAAQRDILALIANGVSLQRTLESIVICAEDLAESEAMASILLLSADGRHLRHAAAPSLPAAYNAAIDGVEIGPNVGACGAAAATGEVVVAQDTFTDPNWAPFRELVTEHGLRAAWSSPIRGDDGELVGTLAVYYRRPRAPSDEDRRVVDLMCRSAGVAIGRARDAEARTRRLAELQSSLLPSALPEVPGLRAGVRFHPAERGSEVGGDFYDMFSLPGDAWGFVIGDVCGHGAAAAAVTALARHATRAVARLVPRPAQVLTMINEELRGSDHDRFCTALYGRLQALPGGMRLTLACGGHPAPLVRRASGEIETLGAHGPLLGVFADAEFPEIVVDLALDDTLLLYTDGLIERNPRIGGDAELRALLRSVSFDDLEAGLDALESTALGSPPGRPLDDTAVLVLQVAEAAPASADPEGVGAPVLLHAMTE